MTIAVCSHSPRFVPSACLLAFCAASATSDLTAEDAVSPSLGVEDVLSMRTFQIYTPIMLSADGALVAYTIKRPKKGGTSAEDHSPGPEAGFGGVATDVWLTDLQTGASRSITPGEGSSWGTAWSPDGQSLALYSSRDGALRLWLWERRTASLRKVSDAPIHPGFDAAELQWTPDGRDVLVRVPAEDAGPALDAPAAPHSGSPSEPESAVGQGPTVRVLNANEDANEDADGVGDDRAPKAVSPQPPSNDLALIEIGSGTVRRIARDVNPYSALISPDGRYLAFMDDTGAYAPHSFTALLDLKLVSLGDGQLRTLASDIRMGGNNFDRNDWSWSPDSRWLAYRDTIATIEAYEPGSWVSDAYLVSLDGEVRPLTAPSQPKFRGTPVWDEHGAAVYFFTAEQVWRIAVPGGQAQVLAQLPGKTLKTLVATGPSRDRLWTLDGGGTAVVVAETQSEHGPVMGFYRVRLDSGEVTPLLEEPKRYVVDSYNVADNLLAAPRTGEIVYVAEDARRPKDIWALGADLRTPRQVTRLNPAIDADAMGEERRIDWIGRDGTPHTGYLLLPGGYEPGRRYPLVTWVYPMSTSQFARTYGYMGSATGEQYYNLQLLATRGYAVLLAGAPLQPGEPMKAVADWALPAIDKAVELGVADANRVGLFGASAGGYCVMALLVQSTRFKAAVEHVGPGNLLSWYGTGMNSQGYSHGEFNAENGFGMAGHPWAAREQYIRNSPWFFLDQVTAPLLILHGADDFGVSIAQPNEIFVGLRRLGKVAQLAVYEGEGHGFTALANQIDAINRYIDWFDRYLKPSVEKSRTE